MPTTMKPPISPDVTKIIGEFAEKVENRSLLLDKFVLHKSWPGTPVKMDDASRWSFIRIMRNGADFLSREQKAQEKKANGRNAQEDNREKAEIYRDVLKQLIPCSCRTLPSELAQQKLTQNADFANALEHSSGKSAVVYGQLAARLLINLSDSLIQNAGICLDRHTGMPYIPGSAVKGVTRHVALEQLRAGKLPLKTFMDIFGSSEADFKKDGELAKFASDVPKEQQTQKGGIDFLAANPITEPSLMVDISTVHKKEYYASGNDADLKKEGPIPNTFPAVEAGATFAFCIVANGMDIPDSAFNQAKAMLLEAITVHGIGAKTGAGYGWFKDATETVHEEHRRQEALAQEKALKAKAQEEELARQEAKRTEKERVAALTPAQRVLERWNRQANQLAALANGDDIAKFDKKSEEDKRAIIEALRSSDGVGAALWTFLKQEADNAKRRIKHAPAFVGAARPFSKSHGMGKMP